MNKRTNAAGQLHRDFRKSNPMSILFLFLWFDGKEHEIETQRRLEWWV